MQIRIQADGEFNDEDLPYIAQQLQFLPSLIAQGPPEGFANWTENEKEEYFETLLPRGRPTPPTIGKCAEAVFAVVDAVNVIKPRNPLESRGSEILFLGCSYGTLYLLALAVELALKHATNSVGVKYQSVHNLEKLWNELKNADPEGAQRTRDIYDKTARQYDQGTRRNPQWIGGDALDDLFVNRASDWEMRYWFETNPHTKETVHHGNNHLGLAVAFHAIMTAYPSNDDH